MAGDRMEPTYSCASCGAACFGPYCHQCGEKRVTANERKLSHLFKDLLESLTSFENRLIRSLAEFVTRPGALTLHYRQGRRRRYLKPVSFFLIINVVYLVLTPISDFTISFHDQASMQLYSSWLNPLIESAIGHSGATRAEFAAEYEQITAITSRTLIILSAPLLAIFLAMLFPNKGCYFGDHTVFALYYYAWVMAWAVLAQVPALVFSSIADWGGPAWMQSTYFMWLALGLIVYLAIASWRAYEVSVFGAIWRIPLMIVALYASHMLFRLIQLLIGLSLVVWG